MRTPKGVSLIELIIYVALASLILVSLGVFTIDLLQNREKIAVLDRNRQSGRVAIDRMAKTIEAGIGLNIGSSTFGAHPGVLSVQMAAPALNPTVFDISGGRLRMTQGANPAVFLTPPNMTVSNLVFTNLSLASVYAIRAQMTINTDLLSGNTNYTATDSYTTTVLLHN